MRCNKLSKIHLILYFLDMIYIYIFIYYLSGYLDNCLSPVSRRLWYCSKISGITPQPPPTLHSPSHCTDNKGRRSRYWHDELNGKKIIWKLNYTLLLHLCFLCVGYKFKLAWMAKKRVKNIFAKNIFAKSIYLFIFYSP